MNSNRPTTSSTHATGSCGDLCAILLALAVVLPGCGANDTNLRQVLPLALDDFHSHLVWSRYSEAAGYLPDGQRGHFLGIQEELGDQMRYTEYEIGSIDLNPETQQAVVTVTLKWYQVPQYIIQTTHLRETWTYDKEEEVWWLTDRTITNSSPTL
ncbi:MAG: hypothetical protein JW797_05350 [Bradymonadales bacterium]|nr:hypothetical protein [Bradymonadales bacterium]